MDIQFPLAAAHLRFFQIGEVALVGFVVVDVPPAILSEYLLPEHPL
jgi:hypothetical protein